MLHSIIITNTQGVLLMARYFGAGGCEAWDAEGAAGRAAWERRLWAAAAPWGGPWGGGSSGGPNSSSASGVRGERCRVAMVDEWCVVWRQAGDLVLFVAGDDEHDELVLSEEVIPLVQALLSEHCERKLTEAALLRSDAYGKMAVSLEEAVRPGGQLFHSSVDQILKMSKLKKLGP